MLSLLAQGELISTPQNRTSAAGAVFVTATLRSPFDDGDPTLVSLIAFDADVCAALLKLGKGDSCAVSGRAKLALWTGKDGIQRTGLSVVAGAVLTVYEARKRRREARRREADDDDQPRRGPRPIRVSPGI